MYKLIVYHLIIINIFILNSTSYIIVIPFKILKKFELNNINDPLTFLENVRETIIYADLLLGEPPNNITSIISFEIEDFSMHHKINNNFFKNTLYNRNNSKTFKKMNNINKDPNMNIEYFKEQVSFFTDLNFQNLIKVKDILFSLIEYEKEKKYKKDDSLCLNIGFKLSENDKENIYNKNNVTNIIMQLKEKNIISSYNFNLHFDAFNINEEIFDGMIVIGDEPHQYLKNFFNEYQLFKTLAFKKDNALSWDILFNKIFYLNSNNENEIIIDKKIEFYNQATLSPNSGLIVGTNNYEQNIKFDYFNELIYMQKCKRENKKFTIFYYCYKDMITKEDIEKFPTLYFSNIELDFIFELNYSDLFIEKDNIFYFLVIFYDFPIEAQNYWFNYISRWELGTPFMKKYFFTYDYDNKYIGFYNTKKIKKDNKNINAKNKKSNNLKFFLIIIIIIFLNIFLFSFFHKYIFKYRKITAIELENNNKSNITINKYNYHSVEMKQKIISNE